MRQVAVIGNESTLKRTDDPSTERPMVEEWRAVIMQSWENKILDRLGTTTLLEIRWRAANDAMIRRQYTRNQAGINERSKPDRQIKATVQQTDDAVR